MYDLAIIGGGPAGLAAAIQGRARGKSVLIVTNEPTASPLGKAKILDNYPGMPGISGKDMIETMLKQAEELGAEIKLGRVLNIMQMGRSQYLSVGSDVVEAKAVVIATGVARSTKLPGESELLGKGVSYCATCDGMIYRGKKVVVAGNSPNVGEEVEFLKGIGCEVVELQLAGLKILGDNKVEAVQSRGERIECDGVFLLRSTMAPTDLLPTMEIEDGYIKVDRHQKTSLDGVYAAGDCTGEPLQVSKAVGEGQMAALSAITQWIDVKEQ